MARGTRGTRRHPRHNALSTASRKGRQPTLHPGATSRGGSDLAKHPIAQTILFLGLLALAFWLLSLRQGNGQLATSDEWLIWKGTAALGQAVAVTLLIHGVARLISVRESGDGRLYGVSVTAAVVVVAGVWLGVETLLGVGRDWAIPGMKDRLDGVVVVGTVCATPWVALVWITYQRVQAAETTEKLLRSWDLIISIAQAFALFVVVAIFPTGALLKLWLTQASNPQQVAAQREVFDTEHVALYGAMYGVIAGAIVLPLVVGWRSKAREHINNQHEIGDGVTASWYEDRAAHEKLLGLDVSLIRNPLTALTVLTPLLTSLIATYLPNVGE